MCLCTEGSQPHTAVDSFHTYHTIHNDVMHPYYCMYIHHAVLIDMLPCITVIPCINWLPSAVEQQSNRLTQLREYQSYKQQSIQHIHNYTGNVVIHSNNNNNNNNNNSTLQHNTHHRSSSLLQYDTAHPQYSPNSDVLNHTSSSGSGIGSIVIPGLSTYITNEYQHTTVSSLRGMHTSDAVSDYGNDNDSNNDQSDELIDIPSDRILSNDMLVNINDSDNEFNHNDNPDHHPHNSMYSIHYDTNEYQVQSNDVGGAQLSTNNNSSNNNRISISNSNSDMNVQDAAGDEYDNDSEDGISDDIVADDVNNIDDIVYDEYNDDSNDAELQLVLQMSAQDAQQYNDSGNHD